MNSTLFFRDDDVGELDKTIVRLIELFQKYDTPLSLQVIPKNLTKEFLTYFNSLPKKHLFDICQHGYDHLPVYRNNKNEGEFGPLKSREEKGKSLKLGWEIIRNNFPFQNIKIFTPPWGIMDQETYRLLREQNYDAISALGRGVDKSFFVNIASSLNDPLYFKKHRMFDISMSVNNMSDFVKKIPSTGEELIRDVSRLSSVTKYVGVMLHDKIMDNWAFIALEELLQYIKNNRINVKTMSDIVEYRKIHG